MEKQDFINGTNEFQQNRFQEGQNVQSPFLYENLDKNVNLDKMKRDGLSNKHVWAYSVGHFNNDLCASMWFVYLTWYLNKVVKLDPTITGLCLLSG